MKNVVEKVGYLIFKVLYAIMPKDKIVVWDSHGASFSKDTFLKKQSIKDKSILIIPISGKVTVNVLMSLARAKVFVTNTNTKCTRLLNMIGHGRTKVVNIWHGAGYFKKFGKDENGLGVDGYRKKYGKPDYVICSSEGIKDKIADVFTIESNRVLPFGTSRSDLLFDSNYIEESRKDLFKKYPILKDKKIYLFAPTWRGTPLNGKTAYFNIKLDFDTVSRYLNEDEIIIIKNHQLVSSNGNRCNIKYNEKVICCDRDEIMRLIVICDVLITDYSSVYFDALMIDKPILFYAEDVSEYMTFNELYDNYETFCPGELLEVNDEKMFVEALRNSKNYVNTEKYKVIKEKFVGNCDGHASERLVDFLSKLYAD